MNKDSGIYGRTKDPKFVSSESQRVEKWSEAKSVFKETMAENFPNLVTNIQI